MNVKAGFSRFFAAAPGRLHFAAHSHHPWPDVSFDAHQQAWLDAAALADQKWDTVFGRIYPEAQSHVARLLSLPDPDSVCFAPSTHELFMRLVSALEHRPLRVLSTDAEFHSFRRQMQRLEEAGQARVTRIAAQPFDSFIKRFGEAIAAGGYDLLYFSQCHYNSSHLIEDLDALVATVPDHSVPVVIDGYHGFMAAPTDLSGIAQRAFYLAGGYKYAMAGEGACFMHCPPGYAERPVHTGWFAAFGNLAKPPQPDAVPYSEGGLRFMGATFDPTPLYRFCAVQNWLRAEGIGVADIRRQVLNLQQRWLELRREKDLLPGAELLPPAGQPRGNFLVLRHAAASNWHRRLLEAGVITDYRDDRLRIGFGIYQTADDLDALARKMERLG
jgi:kynureninase